MAGSVNPFFVDSTVVLCTYGRYMCDNRIAVFSGVTIRLLLYKNSDKLLSIEGMPYAFVRRFYHEEAIISDTDVHTDDVCLAAVAGKGGGV